MQRVAIIGGGIAGMTSALDLASESREVILLEASDQLGGLGTFFQSKGQWIDRFYHSITKTDEHLQGLIDELGLTDQLYWKPTGMGMIVGDRHYPFNGPLDLLRFDVLSLPDRLRLGVTSQLLRWLGEGKELDSITVEDWLRPLCGEAVWSRVWQPLFEVKFGPRASVLPALYIWSRMGRESNTAIRGYLRCGLKGMIDSLGQTITKRGGQIRKNCTVRRLEKSARGVRVTLADDESIDCDAVIATVSIPLLGKLAGDSDLAARIPRQDVPYMGVVVVPFFLSRPLEGFYWSPVLESAAGFNGVIETSALIDRAQYGDRHLAYGMRYCDRDTELFGTDDDLIRETWSSHLVQVYEAQGLRREHILETHVFKAPFVEPAYSVGYGTRVPPFQVEGTRLFLASTAQAYPNVTSWNWSIHVARQAVRRLESVLHG